MQLEPAFPSDLCRTGSGQLGSKAGKLRPAGGPHQGPPVSTGGRKGGCDGVPRAERLTSETPGATEVTVRQRQLIPGALLIRVPGRGDRGAGGAGGRAVARGGRAGGRAERGRVLIQLVKLPLQQPGHGGEGALGPGHGLPGRRAGEL